MVGLRPLGRERLWVLALLAPTLLGLVLGTFGAIFATLGLSVLDWDLLTPPRFVGLQNYLDLPDGRLFGKALWNTVTFAALYVPLVMVFSFAVALMLNRGVRGEGLFRVLYFLPVVSSPTAVGLLWTWIYSEDNGALNAIIGQVGIEPVKWLGSRMVLWSVVIANVWGAVGEGMIIFLAGLQAIPREHYEVARLDGARFWQRMVYVTLPAMAPSLFFQAVLATIHAFQAFDYIYILTRTGNGNSSFPTLVFSIYREGFRFFRMGDAAAQAVVLTAIILAFTWVYFRMQKRWGAT